MGRCMEDKDKIIVRLLGMLILIMLGIWTEEGHLLDTFSHSIIVLSIGRLNCKVLWHFQQQKLSTQLLHKQLKKPSG